MNSKHMNNNNHKQQGLVAIVVTIIMMIVITLIVLGFARISRREQRSALDRQLSTQAFYAAESGVNDARRALESDPGLAGSYNSDCTTFANTAGSTSGVTLNTAIAGSSSAVYTCILVDSSVPEIVFDVSDIQRVTQLKYAAGTNIEDVSIYWDDNTGTPTFGGCPAPGINPVSLTNCGAPIARIELVNGNNISAVPAKVFYIYPATTTADGATIGYGSVTGSTASGNCNVLLPRRCIVTITGLNSTLFYMRVNPIYGSAAFTIKPAGANKFIGSQTIIDVTGKATDVVRRLQVRVPTAGLSNNGPLHALQGTDKICKKFVIDGIDATDQGSCWSSSTVPD